MGKIEHAIDVLTDTDVTGIAIADILHFKRSSISNIKNALKLNNFNIR